MNRMFGMMPSKEVKMEEYYVDNCGSKTIVQSGENGWSLLFADGSSQHKDVVDTIKGNFDTALKVLKSQLTILDK